MKYKSKNGRYTSLAIIGNGFDLAHDYNTSYEDFTNAIGESFFFEYKDYINTYCGGDGEWNNFEKHVEALTAAFYQKVISDEGFNENTIRQFNIVFQSIKEKLIDYLQTETKSKLFHEIKSIRRFLGENTVGLNFNYTNIAENYLCDIMYVHGSINEKEIVLGYDAPAPFCLASYENCRWFKQLYREKLAFSRDIKEKLNISNSDSLYQELCEDYEDIQIMENSGKGFELEDISRLKHAKFFYEYIPTHCNNDIFVQKNISFDNISEVVVLGHSIKSDETYLKEILSKCSNLQHVILFSYKSEKQEDWEAKAQFFRPYCTYIEKEMY